MTSQATTPKSPTSAAPLQRRIALQRIGSVLAGCTWPLSHNAWAQTAPVSPTSTLVNTSPVPSPDVWRALSRVGYGPSVQLLSEIAVAPSARQWALAQVSAAHAASQAPAPIAAELADFNQPLPKLFDGIRKEREARRDIKAATNVADPDSPQLRRLDFSGATPPEHFSRRMVQQTAAWRLTSASHPEWENPLLARMTEFWFNHLNVSVGKAAVRPLAGHYLVNVIRAHALGPFEDLLLASARHPAMLEYLDQVQSVAEGTPGPQGKTRGLNENYARELMELHTLGVNGGYNQGDVRELARVLTGWTVSREDASGFRFVPRLHDTGSKTVLGQTFPQNAARTGEYEGEDAIRMLARHPATAERICTRLTHFFIADSQTSISVERLKDTFLKTRGDMRAVLQTLFELPEFWDPQQRLFKTPLDFAVSALTALSPAAPTSPVKPEGAPPAGFNATTVLTERDRRTLLLSMGFLNNAGQPLHAWPTPDGYKFDAATWLAPEALTRRADHAMALARQVPELPALAPFLGAATRTALEQAPPALRPGLMLASPEFMTK